MLSKGYGRENATPARTPSGWSNYLIILEDRSKEYYFDNSLLALEMMNGSNGIIVYYLMASFTQSDEIIGMALLIATRILSLLTI